MSNVLVYGNSVNKPFLQHLSTTRDIQINSLLQSFNEINSLPIEGKGIDLYLKTHYSIGIRSIEII